MRRLLHNRETCGMALFSENIEMIHLCKHSLGHWTWGSIKFENNLEKTQPAIYHCLHLLVVICTFFFNFRLLKWTKNYKWNTSSCISQWTKLIRLPVIASRVNKWAAFFVRTFTGTWRTEQKSSGLFTVVQRSLESTRWVLNTNYLWLAVFHIIIRNFVYNTNDTHVKSYSPETSFHENPSRKSAFSFHFAQTLCDVSRFQHGCTYTHVSWLVTLRGAHQRRPRQRSTSQNHCILYNIPDYIGFVDASGTALFQRQHKLRMTNLIIKCSRQIKKKRFMWFAEKLLQKNVWLSRIILLARSGHCNFPKIK